MKKLFLLLALALPTLVTGQIFLSNPMYDTPPTFVGGDFDRWIDNHVIFPEGAMRDGVTGVVTVQFTVHDSGSAAPDLYTARPRSPHDALTRELFRLIELSRWSPAMLDGKAVKATTTYSYDFSRKLSSEQLASMTVARDHTPPFFRASKDKKTADGFIVWLQDVYKIPKEFRKKDYRFATHISFNVEIDNSLTDIIITGYGNDDLRDQFTNLVGQSQWVAATLDGRPHRSTVSFDAVFTGDKKGKQADYTGIRELPARFNNGDEPMSEFSQYIVNQLSSISKTKIVVRFVVDHDGSLTDIDVLQTTNDNIVKKVVDVFMKCPRWQPAILNGKTVKMNFVMPVTFL